MCIGDTWHWQEGRKGEQEEASENKEQYLPSPAARRGWCIFNQLFWLPDRNLIPTKAQTVSDRVPTNTAVPGGLFPGLALADFLFSCSSISFIFLYWLWPPLPHGKQVMPLATGAKKKPTAVTVVVYGAPSTRHWIQYLRNNMFHSNHNLLYNSYSPILQMKNKKSEKRSCQVTQQLSGGT